MGKEVFNKSLVRIKRKKLRGNMTKPEKIFWEQVRKNNLGVKFRRQHSIGEYIIDFYCSKARLVVEIDGKTHFNREAREYDFVRTNYLNALDLEVIRFTNYEIKHEMDKVLEVLKIKISQNK